ncbi:MAG TPA: hypothetical protein VFV67_29575 [Actinophytocola sp.]|uniref:hypothetical protein n=1 Tax=Actinophytocola sp. TaxID=1872138 RepID=UPI002DBF9986|nr:hypothetical protein [Actinophytocola sp.]HEU5474814.1 hypothetical protein [Actinophytocola sp.]
MTEPPSAAPDTETEPAGPKLDRRTVIVTAVIAALVLAAVVVGIVLLTGSDDPPPDTSNVALPSATAAPSSQTPSSPAAEPAPSAPEQPQPEPPPAQPAEVGAAKAVADQAVAALNAHDAEAMKRVSCDPASFVDTAGTPEGATIEVVGQPELTGDTATVEVKLTIGDQTTTVPLPLRKQNDTWCVD